MVSWLGCIIDAYGNKVGQSGGFTSTNSWVEAYTIGELDRKLESKTIHFENYNETHEYTQSHSIDSS